MKSSALTINQLSTAIIHLDHEFLIKDLNHAAEQILGLSSRQLIATNVFNLVSGKFDHTLLSQLINKNIPTSVQDIVMELPNGDITINFIITPLISVDTNIKSECLLEIQSSETPKNIQKDLRLQQQSRVSEHLIKNLAHEIKNPLGGIKGAGQLLERKLPADFSKKYTQIIIRESDRLSDLVDKLLMPAKIEQNQQVNIHLLLDQALEVLLLQNQQTQLSMIKDYDPSIPELMLAPNQIQQVLINLIKNAIEAFPTKQKNNNKITLRTRIKNQYTIGEKQHRQVLKIDIEDNGCGIKKELVSDIFFPTISGKQSSGLGLSIAQSMVQRHQGIIELEQKNKATCFSIFLPIFANKKGRSNDDD